MTIICLEGPSAVGKTTTAAALAADCGAFHIPEVNFLFSRPRDEPTEPQWYLERQVDRWRMAIEARRDFQLIVLDGDPFQPVWYGWTYGFQQTPWQLIRSFFREHLLAGAIGFPDRYFLLQASPDELFRRKSLDASRARANFQRHLSLVETLPEYFRHLHGLVPDSVRFIKSTSIEANISKIAEATTHHAQPRPHLDVFDALSSWLDDESQIIGRSQ